MTNRSGRQFSNAIGLENDEDTDNNSTTNKFNSRTLIEMSGLHKRMGSFDENSYEKNHIDHQKRFSKQLSLRRKTTISKEEDEPKTFASKKEKDKYYRGKISANKRQSEKPVTGLPRHIEGKDSEQEVLLLKKDLKRVDTAAVAVGFLGFVLAFIENELFFDNGNQSKIENHILRVFVMLTGIAVTSVFSSQFLLSFVLEAILAMIHCPPTIDYVITNYQLRTSFDISIDAYIFAAMFNRIYLLLRLFNHYTFWTGPRANRICKMNGFEADTGFAMKAYLRYKAMSFLSVGFVLTIFYFGLLTRVFERAIIGNSRYHFDHIWNAFWCIFVSMATIGYGDVFPVTHLGRATLVAAILWGTFVMSLIVVALNNLVVMSSGESSAFDELSTQSEVKQKLSDPAAVVLQLWWRRKLMRRNGASLKERFFIKIDLSLACKKFKMLRHALTTGSKSSTEMIEQITADEEKELEELLLIMVPLQEIAQHITTSNDAQDVINQKSIKLLENSKKIHNLMLMMNRGERPQASRLEDVKVLYDTAGLPVDPRTQRNYAQEFQQVKENLLKAYDGQESPREPRSPRRQPSAHQQRRNDKKGTKLGSQVRTEVPNIVISDEKLYPGGMNLRDLRKISKNVIGNAEELFMPGTATDRFAGAPDNNYESARHNSFRAEGNPYRQPYNQYHPQEPYTANMNQNYGYQSQGFTGYMNEYNNQSQRGNYGPVPYPNMDNQYGDEQEDIHTAKRMLPNQVQY